MPPNTCTFCNQVNPADAKYCNACGGALHLLPCPGCGAVNDVTASACYQCHARLPGRGNDEGEPAPETPAAEVSGPLSSRRARTILGAAALVAAVALGYYGYGRHSLVELPRPATAGGETEAGAPPVSAAANGVTAGGETAPSTIGDSTRPIAAEVPPPDARLAERAPAPENETGAEKASETLRRPNVTAGQILRARTARAGKTAGQAPPRQEVCTNAVAALGLCTMTPEEKRLVETTAALKAAIASPEAAGPGKAGVSEPARQDECTEAVAALGLCLPAPAQQRRE